MHGKWAAFTVGAASIAGIPPLGGYVSLSQPGFGRGDQAVDDGQRVDGVGGQRPVEAFAYPRRIDRDGHGPFVQAVKVVLGVRERAARQFAHIADPKSCRGRAAGVSRRCPAGRAR
jgi:hypothetical protein